MLCDSHIHVGQFFETHTTPRKLAALSKVIGIDRMAVSSTTICEENYPKVLREMRSLIKICGDKIIPVLWITPCMSINPKIIGLFLNSGIEWKCVKIHGGLHKNVWKPYSIFMKNAVEVARQLNVPMLFHTGETGGCEPKDYLKVIENHKRMTFILAHSRPVGQTIDILKKCENVYTDTAFTPMRDIIKMIDNSLIDRMLWGTDIPIISHFYGNNIDFKKYYYNLIEELRTKISTEDFEKLTCQNFLKVFNINQ